MPLRCIYDNLKTAVKEGFGRCAREQKGFKRFSAHHAFEAFFRNVGEAHEKGLVENLVGWARRNILVPVLEVKDFDELNALILERCRLSLDHTTAAARRAWAGSYRLNGGNSRPYLYLGNDFIWENRKEKSGTTSGP